MYENISGGQLYYNCSIGANGVTHATINMHSDHRPPLSVLSENIPFKFARNNKTTAENISVPYSQLICCEKITSPLKERHQNLKLEISDRKMKRDLKKFWRCHTQNILTYSIEIFQNLLPLEVKVFPLSLYLYKYQNQITPFMRGVLIEWMTDVSHTRRHIPETLFIAVNYLDRYLASAFVDVSNFQLIGITCLFIASKLNDVKLPVIEEFAYVTENLYTSDNIIEAERDILSKLDFNLIVPTCLYYAEFYASYFKEIFKSEDIFLFMQSLCEYVLVEYSLCNSYYPSIIAAAIILVVSSYRNCSIRIDSFNVFELDLLTIANCYDSLSEIILSLTFAQYKSNLRRLRILWVKKLTPSSDLEYEKYK